MYKSAEQRQLLMARILEATQPDDGGKAARAITKAVAEWFEMDVLPQLLVAPGIVTMGTPTNQVTVSPGLVK